MSHAYIVVATTDTEIVACEAFAGVQSALGRAFQLASEKANRNIHHINTTPSEETLPDGSLRWVFMDTNRQSVIVFFRKIEEALLSAKDPMSVIGGLSNVKDVPKSLVPSGTWAQITQPPPAPPPVPVYNFTDHSLPVGWHLNGKPALMEDMAKNPFDIKDPLWDLTEDQKWALVEARVRKSPGFRGIPKGYSGYSPDQTTCSLELRDRTLFGTQIRDGEIEALHAAREDMMSS